MATEKQIHWIGEAVQSLLTVGVLYVIFRMIDGPTHQPMIAMAPALRVLVILALIAVAASLRTWRYFRKKARRDALR